MPRRVAKTIPLAEWANQQFGSFAPHINTLRAWARTGRIIPAPVLIGRGYMVNPNAQYKAKK